jgi:hypothetical protein
MVAVLLGGLFGTGVCAQSLTPEEIAIRRWFEAVRSGDRTEMMASMCRSARIDWEFSESGPGGDIRRALLGVAQLQDYRDLSFRLVRRSSDGRTARVEVKGSMRLADGSMKSIEELNAVRGRTNIALAAFEDGTWRHCDYIKR